MPKKTALIIGAGPAGLTAAYELLDRSDIVPVVFEMTDDIGGISKTAVYRGNRIDIGGHRFFSKSQRVVAWWQNLLPLQGAPARDDLLLGRTPPLAREWVRRPLGAKETVAGPAPDPEREDLVMLVRNRLSRIFYQRKFFDYPISLTVDTLKKLGAFQVASIGLGYLKATLAPIKPERSLEDFFINRFGRRLYRTFFREYTEKVWGVPCSAIKPAWGVQRVKGLSIASALAHALKGKGGVDRKVETSLIDRFLYPKLGPGQLWEEAAAQIERQGGTVVRGAKVVGVEVAGDRVAALLVRDQATGGVIRHEGDYVLSSMPVKDLIAAMGEGVPEEVREVAAGLEYRDFMTVGVLLRRLKIEATAKTVNGIIPDNWIYIQDRSVKLGRLQLFNNWSPYLVADPDTVWVGLEYFCNEGDELWSRTDGDFARFAIAELAEIGMIDPEDVLDSTVLRMPKAYPAYFGAFERFDAVREYTDGIANLFLIGRNGMHRYNNADHSMLTAMTAVENIVEGRTDKTNIWAVNAEEEYHE